MKRLLFALLALTPLWTSAATGKVLVVLSGVDYVRTREGGRHSTGYFLSEFTTPAQILARAGFELEIATPQGRLPVFDKISDAPNWFKSPEEHAKARTFLGSVRSLRAPRNLNLLRDTDLAAYDGLLIPGGHAAMEDLPGSSALGRILKNFHETAKPTAAICHGPAALLAAQRTYVGYRMTVFSNAEEKEEEDAGHLSGHMRYYVADALRRQGAKIENGPNWKSHIVRDRELITGQNPQSDQDLAEAFLEALLEKVWSQQHAKVVDASPRSVDWKQGYTTIYVGARKPNVNETEFERRLERHIALVKQTFGGPLRGYKILRTRDLEIAYQNWESPEALEHTIRTRGGAVLNDAKGFMEDVLFKPAASQL